MDCKNLTSACGKACFNCPLFIGEENNENHTRFLEKYNLSDEKYSCKGCRDNHGYCPGLDLMGIDPHCKMFDCIQSKKVEYCFECDEFPCANLQPLAKRVPDASLALNIANLCRLQKLDVVKWTIDHQKIVLANLKKAS